LPFFAEYLHAALHHGLKPQDLASQAKLESVHEKLYSIPSALGERERSLVAGMAVAQRAILLGRSLRAESRIGLRQPLQKMKVAGLSAEEKHLLQEQSAMVLSELNLKELEFLSDGAGLVVESAKPNLKRLGARLGKKMPLLQQELKSWGSGEISAFEKTGSALVAGETLERKDVLIDRKAAEGKTAGALEGMVAELDTTLTPALVREGLMREMVNRIQQGRKERKFNLTDRIQVTYQAGGLCAEILEAEAGQPTFLSGETLTKAWKKAADPGLGPKEEFPEGWVSFRLDVVS
jgi:isoleucyl-tRNA synthetase